MAKQKYIRRYCKLCGKESIFVSCADDKDIFVCTECRFRTSFEKYKLVINQFGFYFVRKEK